VKTAFFERVLMKIIAVLWKYKFIMWRTITDDTKNELYFAQFFKCAT